MSNQHGSYRTVFIATLVQKSALSTGGRNDDQYADAIMARDGLNRPILRGTGLAGALLATLDQLGLAVPEEISRRLPAKESETDQHAESLWLMHHAHLKNDQAHPMVRPNVAIHSWTGAAVDGMYFSTEVLPRGTQWQLIIETDDWRDPNRNEPYSAARLLACALAEWEKGNCWLGRSPARGLGWARLESLEIYRLNNHAAAFWPDASKAPMDAFKALKADTKNSIDEERSFISIIECSDLVERHDPAAADSDRPAICWERWKGTIRVGRDAKNLSDGYGLDTLSALTRDFPSDPDVLSAWETDAVTIDGDSLQLPEKLKLSAAPAWGPTSSGGVEFLLPGSSIRGALRSAMSAHWRRCGGEAWAPNGAVKEPETAENDPVLALFGSIRHENNLLISDAYPAENSEPELHVQEQHAEDEFTQGAYGSSKFDRSCLVSGVFEFELALRIAESDQMKNSNFGLSGKSLEDARLLLENANTLGQAGMLPLGGGIWRGHGWVELSLEEVHGQSAKPTKGEAA